MCVCVCEIYLYQIAYRDDVTTLEQILHIFVFLLDTLAVPNCTKYSYLFVFLLNAFGISVISRASQQYIAILLFECKWQ